MDQTRSQKIAVFDIETAPNLAFVWGHYEQNVLGYVQEWHIVSFAYRWLGQRKTHVYALPDFPLYAKEPENDRDLVGELWGLFDEADIIVGHNSDRFDHKKANARFILHGLLPPSPYRTVDTLKLARKLFAFNSNKLNDLCQHLGFGEKVKTGGFELWQRCLKGDESAWRKMKKYNARDVVLTEKLYNLLKGWHQGHPNVTEGADIDGACPACGNLSPTRRGLWYTAAYQAQRYHCTKCGKWSKGKPVKRTNLVLR